MTDRSTTNPTTTARRTRHRTSCDTDPDVTDVPRAPGYEYALCRYELRSKPLLWEARLFLANQGNTRVAHAVSASKERTTRQSVTDLHLRGFNTLSEQRVHVALPQRQRQVHSAIPRMSRVAYALAEGQYLPCRVLQQQHRLHLTRRVALLPPIATSTNCFVGTGMARALSTFWFWAVTR